MRNSVVLHHALAVLAAACSAVTVFAVARYSLGIEIEAASVDEPRVTVGSVIGTSSVAAALGWSLLAGLEAWTSRGRELWLRIALVVTAVSLLGPLTTPDLTGPGRVLLVVLHLVVGGVTITALLAPAHHSTAVTCEECRRPAVPAA